MTLRPALPMHRHQALPALAATLALLASTLVAAAPSRADERLTLTAAQVVCNRAQLDALAARMEVTAPGGGLAPRAQSLFVTYSNAYGFYEGMVVGEPRYRRTEVPQVPTFPGPGPEHQLGFHLNPSVRELLLNPERTPLAQVSLTREVSTSSLVPTGDPFEVILGVNPTLGGHGPGDLVIDNLSVPAPGEMVRVADTKPGRGLTDADLTQLCHPRLRPLDRRVFAVLQRTLRVDVADPVRGLRYDTRIAVYRDEPPDQYLADIFVVDPETGAMRPTPLVARIQVAVDASGRLTDGHLDMPVHLLTDGPPVEGSVFVTAPLFGGVGSRYDPAVVYPVGGPVPAAPDTFWDFDWQNVLAATAWNEPAPGAARACGQGTPEEIAATPRADRELEHMALDLGGGLTADPAVYDRVVSDVTALRASFPQAASVAYLGRWRPDQLLLTVEPATYREIEANLYHAWDCLGSWYGAASVELAPDSETWLLLVFDGVYDVPALGRDYRALPGLSAAEPNGYAGDGRRLSMTISTRRREGRFVGQ